MIKKIFITCCKMTCEKRKLDAKKIFNYFLKNNYEITYDPNNADIIIIVTCGVVDFSSQEAFNVIDKYKKLNKEILVTGCVPAIDDKEFDKRYKNDKLIKKITTKDLHLEPEKFEKLYPENKFKFSNIKETNFKWINKSFIKSNKITKKIYQFGVKKILGDEYLYLLDFPQENEFYIRVSWGCIKQKKPCSYCLITKAIGNFKSKPLKNIINEFKNGLNKGFKDFYLLSDDIGSYGTDIKTTFPKLLDETTKIDDDYKVKVFCLNPVWLVKYVDEILKILKRGKITDISIPIQSGSNKILKLMNRFNNREKIINAINKIKKTDHNIKLSTHIIVGFPSETEDDFKDSLDLIKTTNIDAGKLFPISIKKGTKADEINPKIDDDEILKRINFAKKFLRENGYNTFMYKRNLFFSKK